jgi:rhodanese-related sulfurtransferase
VNVREATVQEVHSAGASARIVDVREPDEWAEAHIDGAVHVPLATVPAHLDRFDGSPTYVICRSGGRSAQACAFAAQNGLDVANVEGGMLAWMAHGFDVVTGD